MALKIINNILTKNRCYKSGQKRTPIGIQIHTIGTAQGTAQAVADYWNSSDVSACVTYIVDADTPGKVLRCLPEEYYTWADGGYGNRNLITIEICESDFMKYISGASYQITNQRGFEADIYRGYCTAVELCADICKRYGWNPTTKLPSGLYLISSHDEGRQAGLSTAHVDPTHIWPQFDISMDTFRQDVKTAMKGTWNSSELVEEDNYYRVRKTWKDASSQLGAYTVKDNAIAACPFGYSVFDPNGKNVYTNKCSTVGTQAADFEGLSEDMKAIKILDLIHETDKSGILCSVSAAQMILESGYVTTQLAKSANNCFGMKCTLSGNTWETTWDGVSKVNILTWEVYNGVSKQVYADFRKYACIEDSIRDHSGYLLGAMNGSKKRYAGLLEAKDYKAAIAIIKNGGYATDPDYVSKICKIIERFGLNKYDKKVEVKYAVQVGSFMYKSNADRRKKDIEAKTGYKSVTIEQIGDKYYVFCGVSSKKEDADIRENRLKTRFKIDCFIKEI